MCNCKQETINAINEMIVSINESTIYSYNDILRVVEYVTRKLLKCKTISGMMPDLDTIIELSKVDRRF